MNQRIVVGVCHIPVFDELQQPSRQAVIVSVTPARVNRVSDASVPIDNKLEPLDGMWINPDGTVTGLRWSA